MDPNKDAEGFYMLNQDPEVLRYTGDFPFSSQEEAREFIRSYVKLYRNKGLGRFMVDSLSSQETLGFCGFKRHSDQSIDLGYRYHRKYWNQGYASEAALACLDYGFSVLELGEVLGRTSKHNIASVKVIEKCGMEFWKEDICEGIPDSLYYRIDQEIFYRKNPNRPYFISSPHG
ncbi:GNAT family N-acetyltransferase [bacterium]|nr:GNAT family N-acetyltransferase [bacterium]